MSTLTHWSLSVCISWTIVIRILFSQIRVQGYWCQRDFRSFFVLFNEKKRTGQLNSMHYICDLLMSKFTEG